MKFRERKLVYAFANTIQECDSFESPSLNFFSNNLANLDQNSQLLEVLKSQKEEVLRKIELTGVLTFHNKKTLADLVKSVEGQSEFEKLAQLISKAINYGKKVLDCNLFTRKQVFDIMEYVGDAKHIHEIDAATKMLEDTIIPEQQKRMEKELYWRKIDPSIVEVYQCKARAEESKPPSMQMDGRGIFCNEIRTYLVAKYKELLVTTFDITVALDAKKYDEFMRQFEAMLGDNVVDFEEKNATLVMAKDFLLDALTQKAPAYKIWYAKITAKWAECDDGRLIEVFESMQKSTVWDADKNEKVFELASAKYEKELKSRFLQVLDSCILDDDAREAWEADFERSSLEDKVDQFENLQKNNKKYLEKDSTWFRKLDMIARNSPAVFDRFNKFYELRRCEMTREDILEEVNDEYKDLEYRFREILSQSKFEEAKKREFLFDFQKLESFETMQEQIVFIKKEIDANNDKKQKIKPTEKSKSDKESALEKDLAIDGLGLALLIDAKIREYYDSHSVEVQESFLMEETANSIQARQESTGEVELGNSIKDAVGEEVDVEELGIFDERVKDCTSAGLDADPLIEEYIEENVTTISRADVLTEGNMWEDEQSRKEEACKGFGNEIEASAESHDARNFDARMVDGDGQELDLRKASVRDTMIGDFVEPANDTITSRVFDVFGIAEPSEGLYKELCAQVAVSRKDYVRCNSFNMLKRMSGNDSKYAAAA